MELSKKIYVLLLLTATVLLMLYAQNVILPFILALLTWFVIRVMNSILHKTRFLNFLPEWVFTIISTIILMGFLLGIFTLITTNIQQLTATLPEYQANITHITNLLNERFDIDFSTMVKNFASNFEFATILSGLLSALTGLLGNTVTILLYLIFLLLEEKMFPLKLKAMYPHEKEYEKIQNVLNKIDRSISNYVAVKTVISLITGALSYIVLLIIGIDAPFFWAFLIFILNFIPTIGSLIATVFPAIFALLQFGNFQEGLLVLVIVGIIQLIVGNFVEPKVMGSSLNISPLVVLVTLAVWGAIWGFTGMLLSVPITVILIIIMAEFPSTRPIAILLTQDGTIHSD